MKFAHSITISVFAKPGEGDGAIKSALLSLVPFDLEKEKLKLSQKVAKANLSGQGDITIYELTLEKERHTSKFIALLKSKLGEADLTALASQENRVDDDCNFYIRFDKPMLLSGKYRLTDEGNCFHIRMSLAAFPKKRLIAVSLAKKIFS